MEMDRSEGIVSIIQDKVTGKDSAEMSYDGHIFKVEMEHHGWWEGADEEEASARVP